MSFKTEGSFFDKITMGAVGTQKVIELLNAGGHNVIELERYCTSNKIWRTKIKRLRMPDLLCLKCGKRIESRAKTKLGVIMSDTDTNPKRRWNVSLRDEDMVAFVTCYKDTFDNWVAGETINLFSVKDMLNSESETQLSSPKPAYEGSERDRTWKSYVPGFDFTVIGIEEEAGWQTIRFLKPDGHRASKKITKGQHIYVQEGETYKAKEKIVSGVVSMENSCNCSDNQYDFFIDLDSDVQEIKYAAVKALGCLPKTKSAIDALYTTVAKPDIDKRVCLEAYASLLRLGEDVWNEITDCVNSLGQTDLKMEYIFILGELGVLYPDKVIAYLNRIILSDDQDEDEIVAAAIWSLPNRSNCLRMMIPKCFSNIAVIRNHAIAKIEKDFSEDMTLDVLDYIGDETAKKTICTHILTHSSAIDKKAIVERYTIETNDLIKKWILFIIGLSNHTEYLDLIIEHDTDSANTISRLEVLWECYPYFLSQKQSDDIDFVKRQR